MTPDRPQPAAPSAPELPRLTATGPGAMAMAPDGCWTHWRRATDALETATIEASQARADRDALAAENAALRVALGKAAIALWKAGEFAGGMGDSPIAMELNTLGDEITATLAGFNEDKDDA